MKLDGAIIQDLFHYSLAMKGEENGMDLNTLAGRMDAAARVYDHLTTFDEDQQVDADYFESVIPKGGSGRDAYRTEAELIADGHALYLKVTEWAALHGIDARSGEKNTLTCSVCGKPAMTKATQCYFHAFGHEFGTDPKR